MVCWCVVYNPQGSETKPQDRRPPLNHFAQMSFQLPADANLDSPQVKLMNEWREGFLKLDIDTLGKYLHKDFRCVIHPRSLGEPVQSKEDWLKETGGIMSIATAFEVRYATATKTFPG
jgi:hypothetical protein